MNNGTCSGGVAYIDGRYMPVEQATIPITDWGYRRSDVTYDVVGVWGGAFFRLEDHIRRFRASMQALRLDPAGDRRRDPARAGRMRAAFGSARGVCGHGLLARHAAPGEPRHPSSCRNYLAVFAIPWVWVMPPEVQARGAHLIVAKTPRISDDLRRSPGQELPLGRHDQSALRGAGSGRGNLRPARSRRLRHRRSRVQCLRGHRRRRRDARPRRARGHHAPLRRGTLRGPAAPLRGAARDRRGARRCR